MEYPPPDGAGVSGLKSRPLASSMVLHSLLIVEDDESHIELIQRAFESQPDCINLTFARTLQEAKNSIPVHRPDMIIADWLLPDGKGGELITHATDTLSIPVLMMTSHGNEALAVEMMKAGAIDYIVKSDVSLITLPHIVRNAWLEWSSENTRKKLGAALDESELKYREIFNNVNDAIQIHGLSEAGLPEKFIEVNDVACRMLGYTTEEFENLTPLEISTEYHSRPVPEIMKELLTDGHSTFETGQIRKDGTIIPVEVSAHRVMLRGRTIILSVVRDITERKSAEEARKMQHSLLKGVIESTNSAIFSLDRDYRYTSFNSHHALIMKMLYGEDIETGRSIFDYQSVTEDSKRAKNNIDRALAGEQFTDEAYSGEEDSRRYFEVTHNPVKNSDNSIIGVAVFAGDITDRKNAERDLRQSAEKYQTLIESANEGIIVIQDGKIPYANPKARSIIGYPAESLAGKEFTDFVHPEDRDQTFERHLKRIRGDNFESVALLRIFDREGTIHWLEVNAVLIQWNGRPATLNFIIDISKRKKAELALRQSEEKYRNVIEHIQDVFYRTDNSGLIIMASPSFESVFGYDSPDDYLNKPITTLYREPEQRDGFLAEISKKGFVENYPVLLQKKDGTPLVISASSHYYQDTPGNILGIEGILRDVTSEKEAEEALRNSLAEKEVLLKEIHHRVKNNLQIVSGLMYLQSKLTKDPETIEILSACRNRIVSMALLHENLFQVSNFSSVSMEPYINNLVRYLADSYDAAKSLTFGVDIPGDIKLDIDTGIAIGMIITELATNAIKYAFSPGESGRVGVTLHRSGGGMLLVVSDNGKGIPDGFDLTSSPGLGMNLVKNLVKQIHGTMDVKGGKGTEINILFTSGIVKVP
ncbi:MAG: PAS domain S-box protein [Methanomicrobiales archaeon]